MMSRRGVNPTRWIGSNGAFPISSKMRSSPLLSATVIFLGLLLAKELFLGNLDKLHMYIASQHVNLAGRTYSVVRTIQGECSGTLELQKAIPALKKASGEAMRNVLHVGPETCSVMSKLLQEDDIEAWGVEPYDLDDAYPYCKSLVRKGFVRVADIKFQLPYRSQSFSLVLVSDALDYLSSKYLNKTLPGLARVSAHGIVIFTGYPGQQKARITELSKFGRPAKMRSQKWWRRFLEQMGMEMDEASSKRFENAVNEYSLKLPCQVLHLKTTH